MPAETLPDSSAHDSDAGDRGGWLQWLLVAVVFAAALICLYYCTEIPAFESQFRELLGGKPLPVITEYLLQYRTIFMFVAIFAPMAALGTFALHDRSQACSILLALGLLAAFEAFVVYEALHQPLTMGTGRMGNSAGREMAGVIPHLVLAIWREFR